MKIKETIHILECFVLSFLSIVGRHNNRFVNKEKIRLDLKG